MIKKNSPNKLKTLRDLYKFKINRYKSTKIINVDCSNITLIFSHVMQKPNNFCYPAA